MPPAQLVRGRVFGARDVAVVARPGVVAHAHRRAAAVVFTGAVVVAVRGAGQLVARFAKKGRFAVARGRGSGHGSGEVWRVIVAADVGTAGTAGRGGSRVGGSGKEWSFGFSVVVGRTCAVAGTSFGANFTGAIDPSMFFVATANAVVRAAGAVPGTFIGATTHTGRNIAIL